MKKMITILIAETAIITGITIVVYSINVIKSSWIIIMGVCIGIAIALHAIAVISNIVVQWMD